LTEEVWADIPGFSEYAISDLGRVYNRRTDRIMSVSLNNYGHVKITLVADGTRRRYTRAVSVMVAEAFLEVPHVLSDQLVVLDGDFTHLTPSNLAWRPTWFAWKYTRQLKERQPRHYENLPVLNLVTGAEYESIMQAGITEGLLFDDIWKSTYTAEPVYPNGSIFEIIGEGEI
jgi:hypothetical protein